MLALMAPIMTLNSTRNTFKLVVYIISIYWNSSYVNGIPLQIKGRGVWNQIESLCQTTLRVQECAASLYDTNQTELYLDSLHMLPLFFGI